MSAHPKRESEARVKVRGKLAEVRETFSRLAGCSVEEVDEMTAKEWKRRLESFWSGS